MKERVLFGGEVVPLQKLESTFPGLWSGSSLDFSLDDHLMVVWRVRATRDTWGLFFIYFIPNFLKWFIAQISSILHKPYI